MQIMWWYGQTIYFQLMREANGLVVDPGATPVTRSENTDSVNL